MFRYTIKEGGKAIAFPQQDLIDEADLRLQVQRADRWGHYENGSPFGAGSPAYTKVTVGTTIYRVFAVIFPDGDVWDSHLRSFDYSAAFDQTDPSDPA